MTKLTIRAEILEGNLGCGWYDNYAAARALAGATRMTWNYDTRRFRDDGYEIEIEIEIRRNTSGCSRDVDVDVDGEDYELTRRVLNSLTDQRKIFEKFCDSAAEAEAEDEDELSV